ncbi:hypothetical protein H5410_032866 [Solanum commersonii]|uniref:Uncharacterized protein n=1 Tax=Solanum commersonii TaxID=4109 RepID=A0A9J5YP48_SOLCO|nr:hypothetical protein H5410_032866 [Solanum commersonii]
MYNEFLQKKEEDKYVLKSVTRELESLRSDLGELNLWIGDKKKVECVSKTGKRKAAGATDTC